jgi:glucuronosyltransferase
MFGAPEPSTGAPIAPDLDDWLESRAHEPILFVAFGSMLPVPDRTSRTLVRALRALSFSAVWASPSAPAGLDPVDSTGRIRWEPWLPQPAILADGRIRAFVTHAGAGGIQEALWFGKPMLSIPLAWDQFYNAKVVELLGAGLQHPKKGAPAYRLTRKLERVVREPSFADRATQLGLELRGARGLERIREAIREYTAPIN